MKTIKGQTLTSEKKFYFDAKLKMKCPNCGDEMERNFADDYLSYPKVWKDDTVYIACDGCCKGFVMPCKVKSINVVFEYDETKIKED